MNKFQFNEITLHALNLISSLWLYLTRWLDSGTKMWIAQKNVRAKRLQTLSSSRLDCYRVCPLAACHISIIFLPRYLSYLKAWRVFFFLFLFCCLICSTACWNGMPNPRTSEEMDGILPSAIYSESIQPLCFLFFCFYVM